MSIIKIVHLCNVHDHILRNLEVMAAGYTYMYIMENCCSRGTSGVPKHHRIKKEMTDLFYPLLLGIVGKPFY
jgi:hypothetical protein